MKNFRIVLGLLAVVVAAGALSGCTNLPSLEGRSTTTAITDTAQTRLGREIAGEAQANPGKSAIYPLNRPLDAFAARGLLARAAERALDVQYYIWHADTTGYLLFEELWNAAERGVRVRLLLDDNNTAGLDGILAALDAHANIEVRLFNPFVNRGTRLLGYLTDFRRLNRRMHNKSMTADNQATIVGGRNVGDEYFGAAQHVGFADLDVLAFGPVVSEVSAAFDLYWNSDSAYPASLILASAKPAAIERLGEKFRTVRASAEAVEYAKALERSDMAQQLTAGRLPVEWAITHLVYDDPRKGLDKADDATPLSTQLAQKLGDPQREIDLISPYFVPGKNGTQALAAFAERGIRLRILTNSLSATDVAAVHAGYARRREPLLRAGATIFELMPDPADPPGTESPQGELSVFGGSSAASLHAKTFSVDRERVFVGSFNLDPRSVNLNTEMGVVIESAALANAVSTVLDTSSASYAYQVMLDKSGHGLTWVERTADGEKRHDTEPATTALQRLGVGFLAILPIEWML